MKWDALLVDLDGTLVDTDAQHDAALTRAALREGRSWNAFHAESFPGRSADRLYAFAELMIKTRRGDPVLDAEVDRIRAQKWIELEEVLLEDREPDNLDPFGYSREAWEMLASLDLPVRIVTDTPRACAAVVCQILGWEDSILVTRDEVDGVEKPDPAIYTLARSQIEALHPVVLEDTLRGAHAASAAHLPSYLVHGPEGVIAWLKLEFPTHGGSTTTAARKTRSRTRRPVSSARRRKPQS